MHTRRGKGPTSATRAEQAASAAPKGKRQPSNKTPSRVVHIRLWPLEQEAMQVAAESRGLKLASFMRLAALHIAGAPTGAEFIALGLPDLIRHIDGAANNLNQLARAANRNRGIIMSNRDRLVMIELRDHLIEAKATFLQYRIDAAKRPGLLNLPTEKGDR